MDFGKYQIEAARSEKKLSSNYEHLWHGAIGIGTEVGELVDDFKKHVIHNRILDFINVRKEIGDVMWYVAVVCTAYQVRQGQADGCYLAQVGGQATKALERAGMRDVDQILLSLLKRAGHIAQGLEGNKVTLPAFALTIETLPYLVLDLMQLADLLALDFYELLDENIEKLRRRHPGAYTDENHLARKDEA